MKKWILSLVAVFMVSLLAGCGEQISEMLGKVNQILDQQIKDDESENVLADQDVVDNHVIENETENDKQNDGNVVENQQNDDDGVVQDDGQGHGPDDEQGTTVEDLTKRGEYDSIDLPNGYPLPLPPADWRLVQMIKDPEDGHEAWEGVFCFNTELESTIASYEQQLFNDGFSVISEPIDSEDAPYAKHSTKFQYNNDPNVTLEGDMNYHIDHYGNPCTKVYFIYE